MLRTTIDIVKTARPELMTAQQAATALRATDAILQSVCCCDVHKAADPGPALPFEHDMAQVLLSRWGTATKSATRRAIQGLAARSGELSVHEMQAVLDAIADDIDINFVEPAAKPIPGYLTNGYRKAKRAIKSKYSLPVNWSGTDDVVTEWLAKHHLYWIGTYYDKQVSGALAHQVAIGLQQGLGREAIGSQLAQFFTNYPGVPQRPDAYWRGLAANATNRSRNFGLIQAYEEIEVKALQVVAVMDERTSEICQELNGTLIPIGAAVGQRNRMIEAQSPEDVKSISPWVALSALRGKSLPARLQMGVIMPPYHWHCRTTVIEVVNMKRIRQMQREMGYR